jgi:hypothetical protein
MHIAGKLEWVGSRVPTEMPSTRECVICLLQTRVTAKAGREIRYFETVTNNIVLYRLHNCLALLTILNISTLHVSTLFVGHRQV